MTREEAKKVSHILETFINQSEKLQRKYFTNDDKEIWIDLEEDDGISISDIMSGRIRVEPPKRPFKTIREFVIESAKHSHLGYCKRKKDGEIKPIDVLPNMIRDFEIIAKHYTYVDGAYFGTYITDTEDKD